jgi:hypothetical protein
MAALVGRHTCRPAHSVAEAIRAEIDAAEPRAFICGGHRARLPRDLVVYWETVPAYAPAMPAAGRLVAGSQAEIVARTRQVLEIQHYHEPHQSARKETPTWQENPSPETGVTACPSAHHRT